MKVNKMIKNIVFDMGNVLLKFEPGRYAAMFTETPADAELLAEELFKNHEWVAMDRGSLTEEQVVASVCLRLPERLHEAVRQTMDYWPKDMPAVEGMGDIIRALKAAGYGIYLLSNTSERYRQFSLGIPAIERFDGQFISVEYGLLKPERAIFESFCETFRLDPKECLFIDDSPVNIEAAIRFGMEGYVFHGKAEKLKDYLKKRGLLR